MSRAGQMELHPEVDPMGLPALIRWERNLLAPQVLHHRAMLLHRCRVLCRELRCRMTVSHLWHRQGVIGMECAVSLFEAHQARGHTAIGDEHVHCSTYSFVSNLAQITVFLHNSGKHTN